MGCKDNVGGEDNDGSSLGNEVKEGNVVVDGFNEGTWLAVGVAERVGESVGSSW